MSVPVTAESLCALAKNPPTDAAERKVLHDAARLLMHSVERRSDTETRILSGYTTLAMAQVGIDIKLFETLAAEPDKEWTVSELAEKTGVGADFLHRVLRALSSQFLVAEVDEGVYQANHITPAFLPRGFIATIEHGQRFVNPPANALPAWLKENGYREPSGSKDCPYHSVLGTGQNAFEWLQANPDKAAPTFETMAWQQLRTGTWFDGSVDVSELQLEPQEIEQGRTLLVDVGGGSGHQAFAFRKAFPDRKGKMVLQELSVMLALVDQAAAKANDLETMSHDFFEPQPVDGAKAYYLRNVPHDWNDEKSTVILKHLRDAMADDSFVVIDEIVVPPKDASLPLVLYDLSMMVALGSRERSEKQWRHLLDLAGLKLHKVVVYDPEMRSSLIFAKKA